MKKYLLLFLILFCCVLANAQSKLSTKPFDIDAYKKDLDKAAKDFSDFSKIRSGDLKQAAADNSAAIDEENKTFKEFILNQIDLITF